MSALITAVVGSAAVGAYSSYQSGRAAQRAAGAQESAALAGIDEQRRQFDQLQQLLSPFARGGTSAFGQQLDLVGVNGADAQAAALQALQTSPEFTESLRLGEQAILANASATGGLRGGNTQGALMQFRPQLLNAMISDRFAKLGGLASLGANAAAGVGNAGMQTGNNVASLLQQQGAARAGGILGQQAGMNGVFGSIAQGFGAYAGLGGFGGATPPPQRYGGWGAWGGQPVAGGGYQGDGMTPLPY